MESPKKTKRKQKLITIDSILTQESVKDTIDRLVKEQPKIVVMICIYRDIDGVLKWKVTEGITLDQIIAMIEQTKIALLIGDNSEEEDNPQASAEL